MTNIDENPPVAIIMGSDSDWPIMKRAADVLDELGIGYTARVISAHRTPERAHEFATTARAKGTKIIIAGAGGAAHLAGVMASLTPLPVLGVPIDSSALKGLDALLATVQMPGGIPVGTFGIGTAGAKNAALFAGAILALSDTQLAGRLDAWRQRQTDNVPESPGC
ncbi:MAG TPA: 5-(carboxyamino)imidazole ribonucleotide mutase [Hellea balneolensis]|uniref:N5-carboxyaminoimidazole ribonucleotide mutase n=1 Tax=Hellea balneolensis TaxID=287478 RepID=A0A7V5U0X5_9PROT|nr:5-(carboxyamino)imidazole ribonucleotide mutase [Hellea balneolensis]